MQQTHSRQALLQEECALKLAELAGAILDELPSDEADKERERFLRLVNIVDKVTKKIKRDCRFLWSCLGLHEEIGS